MPDRPPARRRSSLSAAQKEEIVRLFESGVFNGAQLARHYGVHRDVVYRHLNAAGAKKGRLAHEGVRELEANIDARQRKRLLVRWEDEDRRLDEFIRSAEDLKRFMDALIRADREGRLAEFAPLAKPRRRR